MKKIIKNLKKELDALYELCQKREDFVDDRSEKWQESEACEEYMDKTMEIEGQASELDGVIDQLQELV